MAKKWLVGTLMAIMLFSLMGCGDSKAVNNKSETEKVLKVGTNPNFAPFDFMDSDGKMAGFDIDLIHAIGKKIGREIQMENIAFDGLIPAIQAGNIDMTIAGMTITEARKKSVLFSDPYYQSGLIVAVKMDNSQIQSIHDLTGKKIAAQIGTTGAMSARKVEGATVREFNASPETFMELKNNGVDAVVNDLPVVQYFIKTNGAKDFKMVGEVLSAESYGIAMNLKNTELAAEVNKALAELKKSGEYDKIYEKWFGQKSPQK